MLTTIKRKRLIAKATQNAYYRRMTFEEIAHLEGIQACRRTLVKAFVLEGYHRCKAAKKPFLTPKHINHRLKWAKYHRNWIFVQWRRVHWTDEAKFYISAVVVIWWVGADWLAGQFRPEAGPTLFRSA